MRTETAMLKVKYQVEILGADNTWRADYANARATGYLWDTFAQAKAKENELVRWESYMERKSPKTRIVKIYTLTMRKVIEQKLSVEA